MEFLNKVEIKGIVGDVLANEYGGKTLVSFSVVTEYAYTNPLGQSIVETMWWNCHNWVEGKDISPVALSIKRGDKVHIIGRLRKRRYVEEGFNGFHHDAETYDVIVSSLELLRD